MARIIFITREGYNLSGARIRCYHFARALRRHGVETDVLSFADNLGAPYGERESEMTLTQKLNYNIRALRMLLKHNRDTVFYIQRLNYHTIAPLLAALIRHNKVLFDCDDWNIRENPKYYLGFYPTSKMEFFTRRLARHADLCIAASRFLENYLRTFNSRVFYIPTGVDTDFFKPADDYSYDSSRVTFSWIGTVYHREMKDNIVFIMDCFAELAQKFSHIFLDIVGDGRYLEEIRRYALTLHCSGRVRLKPWISPDQMPSYLSHIDVGLLPLVQNSRFNEAKSPTKLFEYMALAKPTISSSIGEAKHIIRDGENGFLAGCRNEFMQRMQYAIQHPGVRRLIGVNAQKSITRDFSLHVLGSRLYAILRQEKMA